MTRSHPLIAAVALMLALSACGKLQEKAGETLAEKALEASGGKDADVDVQDGGRTVVIKTPDGEMRQSTGDNLVLPADFPTDITLPGKYKVVSLMTMGATTSVVMEVPQSSSGLFNAIKSGQANEGWKETMSMQGADASMLGFEKEDRSLLVNVADNGEGGSSLSMSLQAKQ